MMTDEVDDRYGEQDVDVVDVDDGVDDEDDGEDDDDGYVTSDEDGEDVCYDGDDSVQPLLNYLALACISWSCDAMR